MKCHRCYRCGSDVSKVVVVDDWIYRRLCPHCATHRVEVLEAGRVAARSFRFQANLDMWEVDL